MKIELLDEPKLEFGNEFICDDPKKGISIGGFYSLFNNTHRSEIHYAVIGTQNNIQDFKDWILSLKNTIEASEKVVKIKNEASIEDGEVLNNEIEQLNIFTEGAEDETEAETKEVNKKLNPDFIGFNKESNFKCEFINNDLNNISILQSHIDGIIKSKESAVQKCEEIIKIYKAAFQNLIDNCVVKPDICMIVIPANVFKSLSSIPHGSYHINFRRKLKAELICCNSDIPVQIILEDTLSGKKKELQDDAMIAWNFVTAQYYKTNSIPWTLTDIDKNACFVGISFHKILSDSYNVLRSSIAQAFNREGKGLIFVGKQFEWDSNKTKVPAPHLTYEYAKDLMINVIKTFIIQNSNVKPNRVVIHKTTDFWNSSIHKDYAEVEGLKDGVREVCGQDILIDLVTIKNSPIKLFRSAGKYPVIRGTLLQIDKSEGVLYTTGYIPYFETFPGVHMPQGKAIIIHEGETTLRNVCNEIMALTKMNFNNCNYYDSLPITLRFAQKVGEIIQYIPEGITPPNKYYYYM